MNTETQIPENETIAQRAYRLLSPIPAEQWITDQYTNNENACCAIGHYNRLNSKNPNNYSIENCQENYLSADIRVISKRFIETRYRLYSDIATVNNSSTVNGYTEETPKERVLHLLTDMIAEGF